jgi:hypothetical protein
MVRPSVGALAAAAAAALALAGCGGADEEAQQERPAETGVTDIVGVPGAEGGMAIGEALEREGEQVLVRGFLHEAEGETRLCAQLDDAVPAGCVEPSVRVEGFSLAEIDGIQEHEGVRWLNDDLALEGRLEDGALHVTGED